MEVKPKTDILETADALGCVLVHKKGEIVRNFLFPFIKRRLKDDIIRMMKITKNPTTEYNRYFYVQRNLLSEQH